MAQVARTISFIAEQHSKEDARNYVSNKITHNNLDILFIEFPNITKQNHTLQSVLDASKGKSKEKITENLTGYFDALSANDAHPNIQELTILALSKNIAVVAADMKVEEVETAYGNLQPDQNLAVQWQAQQGTNIVQYEKLALRNQHMADTIAHHMANKLKGVFLCGSNHFVQSVTPEEVVRYGWPAGLRRTGVKEIFDLQHVAASTLTYVPISIKPVSGKSQQKALFRSMI